MLSIWQKILQYVAPPVDNSENAQHEANTSPPVLRAELQIPHAIIERYEADQQAYAMQERKRSRVDGWRLGVEFATLVSVLGGSVLLYKTLGATQESNRINREALTSVQRAFVSLENIQARATQDTQGNVTTWVFHGQWRNSGATPTQTLRQYSNYRWQNRPFPDDYDFPDLESGKSTMAFIAPKDAVFSHRMTVPLDVMREVQEGKKHLYFWGWAAYKDVFQGSKTHLTEFCRKLTAIEGGIAKGGDTFAFVFSYCPTRNCVDESCKDYAEVEKKMKGE